MGGRLLMNCIYLQLECRYWRGPITLIVVVAVIDGYTLLITNLKYVLLIIISLLPQINDLSQVPVPVMLLPDDFKANTKIKVNNHLFNKWEIQWTSRLNMQTTLPLKVVLKKTKNPLPSGNQHSTLLIPHDKIVTKPANLPYWSAFSLSAHANLCYIVVKMSKNDCIWGT